MCLCLQGCHKRCQSVRSMQLQLCMTANGMRFLATSHTALTSPTLLRSVILLACMSLPCLQTLTAALTTIANAHLRSCTRCLPCKQLAVGRRWRRGRGGGGRNLAIPATRKLPFWRRWRRNRRRRRGRGSGGRNLAVPATRELPFWRWWRRNGSRSGSRFRIRHNFWSPSRDFWRRQWRWDWCPGCCTNAILQGHTTTVSLSR